MLNLAAGNLMVGAANVPGGLCPTKNGEGHFPAVAVYILHIETYIYILKPKIEFTCHNNSMYELNKGLVSSAPSYEILIYQVKLRI